jgi:hypothetical protein
MVIINGNRLLFIIIILSIILYFLSRKSIRNRGYGVFYNQQTLSDNLKRVSYFQSTPNNVIIFTSHNYKNLPGYAEYTRQINKLYANNHQYIFKENYNSANISPYWLKVYDLLALSEMYEDNVIICYLDLDATINPRHFFTPIEKLLDRIDISTKNNWEMYVSVDNPTYFDNINTGAIIIRNTPWVRRFLKEWIKKYDRTAWQFDTGWKCPNCKWAEDKYEQGQLNLLYLSNIFKCQSKIIPISFDIINNIPSSNSFILHLCSTDNVKRVNIFKNMLNIISRNNIQHLDLTSGLS